MSNDDRSNSLHHEDSLLFVIVFVAFVSAWLVLAHAQSSAPAREIDNVAAFARLYGVLRFFYPSDAAAARDWDRVAVEGVARVRTARDSVTLAARLREVAATLGPGIEIGPTLRAFQAPAASTEPLVAWRYLGAGAAQTPGRDGPYVAKRTNRARQVVSATNAFAGFGQAFPAQNLRGKTIRLRGQVRSTARDGSSGGALWLRVDRGTQTGFFDNMGDRLVRDETWREYAIEGAVAPDATNVVFGVMIVGAATGDFDAMELSVREADGTWRVLPIKDPGFENDNGAWGRVGSSLAKVTGVAQGAPEGKQFVHFTPAEAPTSTAELFTEAPPALGDHIDVDLGAGLKARVALTLTDTQAKAAVPAALAVQAASSDLDGRLADVVVAWNVYRHFYPYFADAAVDWDMRLRPRLQEAYGATTRDGELDALRHLVADARDGHGQVADLRQRDRVKSLPLQLELIESRVVVVASGEANIPVGSVVLDIDGKPATDRFASAMELVSGSTQWRQQGAAREITLCNNGAMARVAIDDGNGTQTVELACAAGAGVIEKRPPSISKVTADVWYVDLTKTRTADLTKAIDTLASAKGVVFDVRGYPTDAGMWLLRHLIDAQENDRWMHLPKISGPFGRYAGWQDLGWDLSPASPKLSGTIVFLTDGRAISYAESVMGYVHDRHLATIVGSTTAGTNGNIATFTVPGGFGFVFTGLRVTGHDGRAVHHLVGVKPDVVVTPTIAGLRAGKDEVLERALSLIR